MINGSIRKRRINSIGADGNIRRCKSCDSMRHMLPECLDSWENMQDVQVTELEAVSEDNQECPYSWENMQDVHVTKLEAVTEDNQDVDNEEMQEVDDEEMLKKGMKGKLVDVKISNTEEKDNMDKIIEENYPNEEESSDYMKNGKVKGKVVVIEQLFSEPVEDFDIAYEADLLKMKELGLPFGLS